MENLLEDKIKHEIANVLGLTDEWEDGTYLYYLTRVKEAFNIGTMTLEDFVEIDEELVEELYEAIKPYIAAKEIVIQTPALPESEVIRMLQDQVQSLRQELNRYHTRTFTK